VNRKLVTHWEDELSTWEDELPTLSGQIIKMLIDAMSHIGSLLNEIKLYK
jgi:hypothetical protein